LPFEPLIEKDTVMTRVAIRNALIGVWALFALGGIAGAKSAEKVGKHGRIDWDKSVLYATGLGAIPQNSTNEAKAYLKARGFAKLDALRNMLMTVRGVRIDSHTVGADYVTSSDIIRAQVEGIVKGAEVVSERSIRVGRSQMVEVTIVTPLYGDEGVARAIVPEMKKRANDDIPEKQARVEVFRPKPTPIEPPIQIEPRIPRRRVEPRFEPDLKPRLERDETYTSVIVDTRGFRVDRSMAPKIRRPNGDEVWGTLNVDPEFVIEHGICAYARSMSEARANRRAGGNPLVVRAIGRAGGAFNCDAVISDRDADLVLSAARRQDFLKDCRVIFLVDADK
jgi:hypothetical protein